MKRVFTLLLLAASGISCALAQNGSGFTGNGYYRIKNFYTGRYIYVTDNKDYYDKNRDVEDFQAIQLWQDINRAVSDPASVLYMEEVSSGNFDLRAQGTGVHALTGYYVSTRRMPNGTYEVSASAHGVTKYLSDNVPTPATDTDYPQGKMGTYASGENMNTRRWVVDRIETNHASNYVGIQPTIELNGLYYKPFYASFPFKAVSPDMHIYIIDEIVGKNIAGLKEITGVIPAQTPVIIQCASNNPSNNRLELFTSSSAKVTGNLLSGVYFCNSKRPKESTDAYTRFDEATMRFLKVVDGNLVMTNDAPELLVEVTVRNWTTGKRETFNCLPANSSYLNVDASTSSVLLLTTDPTGIAEIHSEAKKPGAEGVYTIAGTRLRATNDMEGLPAGLYIVGGKKIVKN